MFTNIALQAANGSYLIAEGGDTWDVCAIPREIGAWETFRLFNRTRPGEEPQHGDSVVLQAWHGRFLSAVSFFGSSILNAALRGIEASTTFTLERVAGAGTIRSGDQVALRAASGNYVVAEGGRGGDVNVNRPVRGSWETFTIKMFRPQLVRLRAWNGRYVTAEAGGGALVTANRRSAGTWETFSLHNLSRPERAIRNGDTVALQVWNGKFIQAGGAVLAEVIANVDRASLAAQFIIRASGVDEIGHLQRVRLRPQGTSKLLAERRGNLVVTSSATANTFFALEFAEQAGIDFEWVPEGLELPDRPMATPSYPVSGNRQILVLHVDDEANPPLSISNEQVTSALFGPAPSLAEWYRTMSGGAFTVSSAGVFGPITILGSFTLGQILTMAEAQGVPLASFAREGVISDSEVGLVRIGVGPGGQTDYFDVLSGGGVRYRGKSAGVGVSPDVNERSRMVIAHETSHMFLDEIDRYGTRRPIRGDVVANRTWVGEWERFVVERVAGTGPLRSGDQIMLRAHNGKHLAVGSSPPDLIPGLINTEGGAAGDTRIFTIAKVSGTAEIASGERVTFQSIAGRFMRAELGGNSAVTANRTIASDWDQFEIRKLTGTGNLNSGDTVTLKSLKEYFLAAETDARDKPRDAATDANDRRRKYIWAGGVGAAGNFDNSSANKSTVMLSVYDRIRAGWVTPRYLTPDNRGCYVMHPFIDSREALILFDPLNPGEWYTVEYRVRRENVDEVHSSGIVISWICEDEDYWQGWFGRADDPEVWLHKSQYPAVISAAAPEVPPNGMARPVLLSPDLVTKRNDPNAAFRDQEVVLPLGNGDPSRFHLSFHPMDGESIAICIR